jgi:hypothetical protein
MTDHFIQQQIAEFARKYPSAAPKKEIAKGMPKVAQSATPAPAPKKPGVIQLQCTNFPKNDSESSEDSDDSEDSYNIASDESSYESDESSDDLPRHAKFLLMCAQQGAQFHK